jgi:hypothetical protein
MKYEEFKLFIQSIGFVYERQMKGKEFYKLGQFELELGQSFHGVYYNIVQKIQLGVTRPIITSSSNWKSLEEDLSVFKSILREHKLKDLGI